MLIDIVIKSCISTVEIGDGTKRKAITIRYLRYQRISVYRTSNAVLRCKYASQTEKKFLVNLRDALSNTFFEEFDYYYRL